MSSSTGVKDDQADLHLLYLNINDRFLPIITALVQDFVLEQSDRKGVLLKTPAGHAAAACSEPRRVVKVYHTLMKSQLRGADWGSHG